MQAEAGEVLGVERQCRRQRHRQRVHRCIGDAKLIVQMRPGRPAGLANVADDFTLTDPGSFFDARRKIAHVRIQGGKPALVANHHQVAVAALASRKIDHAVGGCANPRTARRAVIHAGMLTPGVVDRVHAPAEAGSDAREFQRRTQKCLAQIFALRRVVARRFLVVRVFVPDRGKGFAVVHELRRQHTPGFDELALVIKHLVHHAKTVAAADVFIEINVAGKYFSDLRRHAVRQSCSVGGTKE